MPMPFVLFVPGCPDATPEPLLTHAFAQALALGGRGAPVLLPPDSYAAVAWGRVLDRSALPGAAARRIPSAEEVQFYRDLESDMLTEGAHTLEAPVNPALLDALLLESKDPQKDTIRNHFAPLWDYVINRQVRYGAQTNVMNALARVKDRALVVLAHGLGCVAALDVLFKMGNDAPQFELVTCGSPLGLDSVKKRLKAGARPDGMQPVPDCIRRWTNLAAGGDPVCADPTLGDEYRWNSDPNKRVDDRAATVDTPWPHHRWDGYLRSAELRTVLAGALSRATTAFYLPPMQIETAPEQPLVVL